MTGKPTLLAALTVAIFPVAAVHAAELAPHRASYDLSLSQEAGELLGVEGRIAMELSRPDCDGYDLDYRFVARFQQENELIVTDQQTVSSESLAGDRFEFQTKTFVDGNSEKEVSGTARNEAENTLVEITEPQVRSIELPKSLFPMQHTAALIEKARAGEHIVETRLFDGDDEAEKLLTSTAIIAPVGADVGSATGGEPAQEDRAAPTDELAGMPAWRISESFYNSDSDPDGLPIFETAYTLYENGVSDELVLKFDGYTLEGGIASLDLLDQPDCG